MTDCTVMATLVQLYLFTFAQHYAFGIQEPLFPNWNYNEVWSQVYNALRPQIHNKFRSQIHNELRPQIHNVLRPQIHNKLRPQIHNEFQPQIHNEYQPQIHNELRPDVYKSHTLLYGTRKSSEKKYASRNFTNQASRVGEELFSDNVTRIENSKEEISIFQNESSSDFHLGDHLSRQIIRDAFDELTRVFHYAKKINNCKLAKLKSLEELVTEALRSYFREDKTQQQTVNLSPIELSVRNSSTLHQTEKSECFLSQHFRSPSDDELNNIFGCMSPGLVNHLSKNILRLKLLIDNFSNQLKDDNIVLKDYFCNELFADLDRHPKTCSQHVEQVLSMIDTGVASPAERQNPHQRIIRSANTIDYKTTYDDPTAAMYPEINEYMSTSNYEPSSVIELPIEYVHEEKDKKPHGVVLKLLGALTLGAYGIISVLFLRQFLLEMPVGAGPPGLPGNKGAAGENGLKGFKGNKGVKGVAGENGITGDPGDQGKIGAPGSKGLKGSKGETGRLGIPGLRGETGDPGLKGEQGRVGFRGESGLEGIPGTKGEKGNPGEAGVSGPTGKTGSPGEAGVPGPKGEKGSPGKDGMPGPKGKEGNAGETGIPGPKGENGSPGETGKPGPKGQNGNPGEAGIPGLTGQKGSPGEAGLPGSTGKPGEAGMPGPIGQKGSPGESGKPGPPGGKGEPGQTGKIGPAGQQGSPGEAGIKGLTGQKGSPGTAGMTGPTGRPGEVGMPGLKGLKGSPGEPGLPGPTGQKGSPGDAGIPGPPGGKGESGVNGMPGMKGEKGDTGNAGEIGMKGFTGDIGTKGNPGERGEAGPKGLRGYDGLKGDKGTTGMKGHEGTKGMKGDEGTKGMKGDEGAKGMKGDEGAKGMKGDEGSKGMKGDEGTKGMRGDEGTKGMKGDEGAKGMTGDEGDKGMKGDEGSKGMKGDEGTKGMHGDNGHKGMPGENGPRPCEKGHNGMPCEKGHNGMPCEKGHHGLPCGKGHEGIPWHKGTVGVKGPESKGIFNPCLKGRRNNVDCPIIPKQKLKYKRDLADVSDAPLLLAFLYENKSPPGSRKNISKANSKSVSELETISNNRSKRDINGLLENKNPENNANAISDKALFYINNFDNGTDVHDMRSNQYYKPLRPKLMTTHPTAGHSEHMNKPHQPYQNYRADYEISTELQDTPQLLSYLYEKKKKEESKSLKVTSTKCSALDSINELWMEYQDPAGCVKCSLFEFFMSSNGDLESYIMAGMAHVLGVQDSYQLQEAVREARIDGREIECKRNKTTCFVVQNAAGYEYMRRSKIRRWASN